MRSCPTAWKYAEATCARNPNGAHASSGRKCEAVSSISWGSSPMKKAEMGSANAMTSPHTTAKMANVPARLAFTSSRRRSKWRAPRLKLAMGCRP